MRRLDAQAWLEGPTVLKLLGTRATDGSGRALLRYVFSLGPDGALVLNGSDVTMLLR